VREREGERAPGRDRRGCTVKGGNGEGRKRKEREYFAG